LLCKKKTVEVTKLSKKAYGARKDTTYCYEKEWKCHSSEKAIING
jgi:hypothetical protein